MFLGTHAPLLDDKGRLVLPAKFREGLAAGLVLTKGQERSIVVWPAAQFASYAERLNEASRSDAQVRVMKSPIVKAASWCHRHCANMPGCIARSSSWVMAARLKCGMQQLGVLI